MDSDPSDISPSGHRRFRVWPELWAPALMVLAGVVVSLVTAQLASETAQHLAHQHYYATHQSLVRQVAIHLQSSSAPSDGTQTLKVALTESLHDDMGLRIDTLERHTKTPLIQLGTLRNAAHNHTLRTELETNGQHWMVTTIPDERLLSQPARKTRWLILTGGLVLTALATLVALVLCRQSHRKQQTIEQLLSQQRTANQQLTNLQVEKSVLRHALNDSESRSRDLVSLSGAIIGELDEIGQIGFLSAQTADFLGHAPSDLIDQPFAELVTEPDRQRFNECLDAARRERTMARIDLNLLHHNPELIVPMVVRVMVLKNPVHGITGFRLSAVPGDAGHL